jgi:hypothetical protein
LRHHLERDLAFQAGVLGAIDPRHAPFTDTRPHHVDTEV